MGCCCSATQEKGPSFDQPLAFGPQDVPKDSDGAEADTVTVIDHDEFVHNVDGNGDGDDSDNSAYADKKQLRLVSRDEPKSSVRLSSMYNNKYMPVLLFRGSVRFHNKYYPAVLRSCFPSTRAITY